MTVSQQTVRREHALGISEQPSIRRHIMMYIFFSGWGINSVAVPRNYLLGTNSLRLQNISNCIG